MAHSDYKNKRLASVLRHIVVEACDNLSGICRSTSGSLEDESIEVEDIEVQTDIAQFQIDEIVLRLAALQVQLRVFYTDMQQSSDQWTEKE